MINVEGECICGELRFTATLDEKLFGICHCRDCQKMGGSAYRITASASPENFAFTKGEPKIYVKSSERGPKRHLAFCPTCGTHLAAFPDPESDLQTVSVRISCCDNFPQDKPIAECFTKDRVDWLNPMDGLMQFVAMPPI